MRDAYSAVNRKSLGQIFIRLGELCLSCAGEKWQRTKEAKLLTRIVISFFFFGVHVFWTATPRKMQEGQILQQPDLAWDGLVLSHAWSDRVDRVQKRAKESTEQGWNEYIKYARLLGFSKYLNYPIVSICFQWSTISCLQQARSQLDLSRLPCLWDTRES